MSDVRTLTPEQKKAQRAQRAANRAAALKAAEASTTTDVIAAPPKAPEQAVRHPLQDAPPAEQKKTAKQLEAERKAANAAKADAKKQADAKNAKKDETTKTEAKTEAKAVATFNFFLEYSAVKCLALSPDNSKVVQNALKYFEVFHKTLSATYKETEADNKVLSAKSDEFAASVSLTRRETLRLMITERDANDKPVLQLLLKPLYISPYAIICVVEANNKPNAQRAKQSIYSDIVNAYESELTCYEAFQFNPLQETLCQSAIVDNAKKKHKVTFQFVNIVAQARKA